MSKTKKQLEDELKSYKENFNEPEFERLKKENDFLSHRVKQMSEANDNLGLSNKKLHHEIEELSARIKALENRKTIEEINTPCDPNDLTVNSIVTPVENFEHFEKGHNAQVTEISDNKQTMKIKNIDNMKVHREETEVPTKLFRIIKRAMILIFILFAGMACGQTDSTGSSTVITDNSGVILNSIVEILKQLGINVSPFSGVAITVILFIIRHFEKRRMKKKIATDIKSTVENSVIPDSEVHGEHGIFRRLIDKLEGKKKK